MPAALDTVADYVTQARILLQDTIPDYRYPDIDIVNALNHGLQRARLLRADLFIATDGVPPYFTANDNSPVDFEIMYRPGLLLYIVGQIQLRDEEDTQDSRAALLINTFINMLEMGSPP